ncbi:MAG: RluA family pseudouridine synthase [Candidatus Brocadiae bacterium]|nr:RluA family pseudouridine synthase [Candidatus Brocadiia bacterium]
MDDDHGNDGSVHPPRGEEVEVRRYEFEVAGRHEGRRLDAYLAGRFPDYSRTFIQELIKNRHITVNGRPVRPSYSPSRGDTVVALVPMRRHEEVPPEDIPLQVLFEDRWLVVVNKPPDLVVHPSRGHQTGTLVNALVHRFQHLSGLRGPLKPGIVHRLDRDTSGVILVIKDEAVHEKIARQFEHRQVTKEYVAVCEGRLELDSDLIDAPIGSDPRAREKMAVRQSAGRPARTVYQVVERIGPFTIVRCFPQTGRTHQIRVHLQFIGHPIVADSLYGRRDAVYLSDLTGGEHPPEEEPLLHRQALHARRLTIRHPVRQEQMTFEAPMPADMLRLVEALRQARESGQTP